MPGYKGHLLGGLATCFLIHATSTKLFSYPDPTLKKFLFTLIFALLGSLFPDIDTKSVGQKIFYTLLTIPLFFAILTHQWRLLTVISLISIFPVLVNHRGIIHTVWFVALVPLSVPIFLHVSSPHIMSQIWTAYTYFVAGALSHILLDRI
jgi:hypothetical protein